LRSSKARPSDKKREFENETLDNVGSERNFNMSRERIGKNVIHDMKLNMQKKELLERLGQFDPTETNLTSLLKDGKTEILIEDPLDLSGDIGDALRKQLASNQKRMIEGKALQSNHQNNIRISDEHLH